MTCICVEAKRERELAYIADLGSIAVASWARAFGHITSHGYGSEEDSGYTKERINTEDNAIVAGPVAVPAGKNAQGEPRNSIFVAVARSENRAWAGYLADCVMYRG